MKWLKWSGLVFAVILVCGLIGGLSYFKGTQTQAYTPSPWGYFAASGGGVWPSVTTGGTDGAAVEFTGAAATTLWMASFDMSVAGDKSVEWSAWFPADYLNNGSLSDIKVYWITDDVGTSNVTFLISVKAVGDGDLPSIAYSSPVTVTDNSNGQYILNICTFSSSLLPANSPVRGDDLVMRCIIDDSETAVDANVYIEKVTFRYPRVQ